MGALSRQEKLKVTWHISLVWSETSNFQVLVEIDEFESQMYCKWLVSSKKNKSD